MNIVINRTVSSAISTFLSFLLVAQSAVAANPVCGDSIVEVTEQCDFGAQNGNATSGCSSTCQVVAICGNNIAEGAEQCDDSNLPLTICTNACQIVIPSKCGNKVIDPGEDCEPSLSPSNCNLDCTFARCGDGKLSPNSGEQCDAHGEAVTCNNNCKFSVCGDSVVNTMSGEQCDAGTQTAACNWNCKFSLCGDGVLNQAAGEECDNGANNTLSGPCLPTCKFLITVPTTAATNQTTTAPAGGGGSDPASSAATWIGVAVAVVAVAMAIPATILAVKKWRAAHPKQPVAAAQAVPMTQVGKPNPAFGASSPGLTGPTVAPAAKPAAVPPLNTAAASAVPSKPLPPAPVTPTGSTTPTAQGAQAGSTTPKGKTTI